MITTVESGRGERGAGVRLSIPDFPFICALSKGYLTPKNQNKAAIKPTVSFFKVFLFGHIGRGLGELRSVTPAPAPAPGSGEGVWWMTHCSFPKFNTKH